jgi:hypothetical protein
MAWLHWSRGAPEAGREALRRAGYEPGAGTQNVESLETALALVARGDTLRTLDFLHAAIRARPLDAGLHGLLADVYLTLDREAADGVIEALAACALAPATRRPGVAGR